MTLALRKQPYLGLRVRIIYSRSMYHARLAGNFLGYFQKAAFMGLYSFTHTHTHLNKNELAENGLSMNWEPSVESSEGTTRGRCHGPQVSKCLVQPRKLGNRMWKELCWGNERAERVPRRLTQMRARG